MFCFVVLHYLVKEETILCVNSILQLIGEKRIIIVDNASPNGSGKELEQIYSKVPNIDVIVLPENVGFAKGNNAGYLYAKKIYQPESIVIMNNDIQIAQQDFIITAKELYKAEKYAVLGPDVYATSLNIHQSPKRLTHYTQEEVHRLLKQYEKKCSQKRLTRIKCRIKRVKALKRFVYHRRIKRNLIDHRNTYYDVPLHGSCLIFSEPFIQQRDYAFFNETFMYYETEILDYECQKKKFKTMYTPRLQVLHHHNVATNQTFQSDIQRTVFMNTTIRESLSAFHTLMEKDGAEEIFSE
ncbi:glycosyltransferase [Enterococcus sp. AZ196]|uniref:glycosyltransferase n=1 Tax=Enterococcus sp. AZ196 TaxID=2774659 RepID=UPI003D2B359A